ncbi:MAG: TonB C-terminal domain-containing protein [Candidatus Gastranaerophilales bacterium]|nr:TonB C-terminal domain-containing protein [Candidatus Gastranaerophilales bacterium]
MFRCKECGFDYDIKPDYCECGNDEFDEIIENKSINSNLDNKKEPHIYKTKNDATKKNKIHIPSVCIFMFCLLLSAFVLLFAWNPKAVNTSSIKNTKVENNQNIPNIDKIWNSSTPSKMPEKQEKEPSIKQQIEEKPIEIIQQTKEQNINKTIANKQNKMPKQQVKTQKIIQTPVQIKAKPVSTSKINKQELNYYKYSLRNKIASKIDFTNILGDGTCVVSFTLSKAGALQNRRFTLQSDNGMLNDAVYEAVLAVPTYTSPPSAYNNEVLNFTVKFYNGNFEITLI